MTLTEEIRRAFCAPGREQLIALDWDTDIAPLIGEGKGVQFLTLSGDSVAALVSQLKATPQLSEARQIVFELIINPSYEFPFSDVAPLSDYFASLPSNPEILWGYSRSPEQSENLKLNIIITLQKMTRNELTAKLSEIDERISALNAERENLAWDEGPQAIIAKMKEMGKNVIELRAAEENEGYFSTMDLWGYFEDGYFAVKKLKLNENDELVAVYNTLWNNEQSYESNWEYDDEDMEIIVDKFFSDNILTKILLPLLTNDAIYDVEADEDEDGLDLESDNNDEDLALMFGGDPDDED